jgi:acyl-CoA thioesterase FadM
MQEETSLGSVVSLSNQQKSVQPNSLQYEKEFRITFADTNAEGNVSQYEYAKYFGVVRELFAMDCIPNFVKEAGHRYLLKTQNATYDYIKDFYFGDVMLVRLRVRQLLSAALTLEADYINVATGDVHARGCQQIVYTDINGVPRRIPQEFRALIQAMLVK